MINKITSLWNSVEEVCGVITASYEIIPITNVANFKDDAFVFSKREYLSLLNAGVDIVATYHTHPSGNPTPSAKDLSTFNSMPYDMIIIGANGKITWLKKD